MKAAFVGGLTNTGTTSSSVSFQCPTGNCTFSVFDGITHSSIGYCSKCEDVTSTIVESGAPTWNSSRGQGGWNNLSSSERGPTYDLPNQAEIDYWYLQMDAYDCCPNWLTSTSYLTASSDYLFNATVLSFTHAGCTPANTNPPARGELTGRRSRSTRYVMDDER